LIADVTVKCYSDEVTGTTLLCTI